MDQERGDVFDMDSDRNEATGDSSISFNAKRHGFSGAPWGMVLVASQDYEKS